MYCSQCGSKLVEGANFCAQCGTPVAAEQGAADRTTAAIEIGALDPAAAVDDSPDLEGGTGMLVVVRGPNAGARFFLDRDVTSIGRHPDCDVFLHDVTVSRRHTEVRRQGDGFVVRDLGSLNGSYLNGERVEERELTSGDEMQVGRFKLLFLSGVEAGR